MATAPDGALGVTVGEGSAGRTLIVGAGGVAAAATTLLLVMGVATDFRRDQPNKPAAMAPVPSKPSPNIKPTRDFLRAEFVAPRCVEAKPGAV